MRPESGLKFAGLEKVEPANNHEEADDHDHGRYAQPSYPYRRADHVEGDGPDPDRVPPYRREASSLGLHTM